MSLNLSVLGPIEVRLDGRLLTQFGFDRVRALLVYLAVEHDSVHDRSMLAYLLWPEDSRRVALQNLRQALATLRRVLQEKKRDVPLFLASSYTLQFNPQSDFKLDLSSFSATMQQIEKHTHRRLGACSDCMSRLQEAARLYRGDFLSNLLIDSNPFEEWVHGKREPLHMQMLKSLAALSDYHFLCGQYEPAIRLAQRQLVLNPLSLKGHHQLIRSLAADGRRNAAIAHYKRYRDLLADELLLSPPIETITLYNSLRSDSWQETVRGQQISHNLPIEVTSFVGFEKEQRLIKECLAQVNCRLLTLVGPGGCGKTRLALHVGYGEVVNFHDGVYFVDLTADTTTDVYEAILNSLPLSPQTGMSAYHQLVYWLKTREVLLILDGFEQRIDQTAHLFRLLRTNPRLNLLVTSREWLKLQGERVMEIHGFDNLEEGDEFNGSNIDSGLQLFEQTARLLRPDFALVDNDTRQAVVDICRRLGGLPLGIELAAYWTAVFNPTEIAERITESFDFLSNPPYKTLPDRHCTLQAIFNASWQTLSEEEQRVLYRLSIFQHDFNLTAGQAIAQASLDILLSLQTRSCIQYVPSQNSVSPRHASAILSARRYMVPELLRHYALQTRTPEKHQELQGWHCLYYLRLLENRVEQLTKDADKTVSVLRILQLELANIQQAWYWAREQDQNQEQSREAEINLATFYSMQAWYELRKQKEDAGS